MALNTILCAECEECKAEEGGRQHWNIFPWQERDFPFPFFQSHRNRADKRRSFEHIPNTSTIRSGTVVSLPLGVFVVLFWILPAMAVTRLSLECSVTGEKEGNGRRQEKSRNRAQTVLCDEILRMIRLWNLELAEGHLAIFFFSLLLSKYPLFYFL